MVGRQLSHYQILEPLGSGGMGEVFKARDTRLNRLVAVKILRSNLVADPSRKQRLIVEAQSASALNHPNIVTVHDIFQHEETGCLVMEYIAGKTLDALIPKNGMRLGEALRIAVQIAEGLRKAHSAGIVHRDIKPSNIIVADAGIVKILDFGLAKLTESATVSGDATTRTLRPDTEEGAVMGTVAYMSPEQAEGRKVDARTDIFSFGALLYEMLSGRRAFGGNSKLSTMSAILKDEPKPLEHTPTELDKIVRRCLRKDRDKRYQHADDLKLALEEVRDDSESGKLETARLPPKHKHTTAYIATAAAVLFGGGYYAWRHNTIPPSAAGYSLRQITADGGFATTPAISPDGKFVAFASDRQSAGNLDIWVLPLTAGARPVRITTHPADDISPDFSPDGASIVFVSKRDGGGIYTVPYLGGEERLLAKSSSATVGPRYSPDGKSVAFVTGQLADRKVVVLPSTGGPAKTLAPNLGNASSPAWSPDGSKLITVATSGLSTDRTFWVIPADGSPPVNAGGAPDSGVFDINWLPTGLIYTTDRQALSVPIDVGSWKLGMPRKLFESTAALQDARPQGSTGDGPAHIVLAVESTAAHLWALPLESNTAAVRGRPKPLPHSGGSQSMPAISPDGRSLAYAHESLAQSELRLRDLESGSDRTIAAGVARPKFSPDGKQIAYYARDGVYLMDSSGGEARKILDTAQIGAASIYGWHSRGIAFWFGNPTRFSLLDPGTKQLRDLIAHPTLSIHGAELSPDGQWLAFRIPGPPADRLYVAPVRDGKAAGESEWILIPNTPGQNLRPWWSADGNLLYYLQTSASSTWILAHRLGPDKHPKGDPIKVFAFPGTGRRPDTIGARGFGPAVTPSRIIYSLEATSAEIWLAEANR